MQGVLSLRLGFSAISMKTGNKACLVVVVVVVVVVAAVVAVELGLELALILLSYWRVLTSF